ncbi:hypothetical protein BDF22DRAFT_746223 [Syncephalis plumigaleata]|nr:hypothetical protein BDF22DRAFT_746223 [Syncephalis plumigaleata]
MVIKSPVRSYSKLETLLVLLPPSDSDNFFRKLDDTELLELECTSHITRAILRQSNEYWRGCYGRRFCWYYVEHEQDFLLWYRNKVWRESQRPNGASIDLLDRTGKYTAFTGVNWRSAYQYRVMVQQNWLGKQHRHWCYDEYASDTVAGVHIMPTSASSIPLKLVNNGDVRLAYLRPAEIPTDIDTAFTDAPTLSTFDQMEYGPVKHAKPIISNGCYTVVESNGVFYVRATYSDNKWTPIEIRGFIEHSSDFKRTITFGRWVVFRGYSEQDPSWLINLATRQHAQLPQNIRYVHAILSAKDTSITLLTASTSSSRYRVDWYKYRCSFTSTGKLAASCVDMGYYQITAISDRVAITSLGPDYAGGQEPLCYLEEAWPAYRLDRRRALVETQYFCNIIDLPTGHVLHAYNYGALLNLKPILGGLFLSTGRNSTQIIDVYSGVPQTTIVTTKQINWPLIKVYSTFMFFKPVSGAISIFDFTVA